MSGPSMAKVTDGYRSSVTGGDGGHYNIFRFKNPDAAYEMMKEYFPSGECNDLNFVLFSTSGVHGSYGTIESCLEDGDENGDVTVLLIQPRLVSMTYGNVRCNKDTADFLKKLRSSSHYVIKEIGIES